MITKTQKKLRTSKETLRQLTRELSVVNGGNGNFVCTTDRNDTCKALIKR